MASIFLNAKGFVELNLDIKTGEAAKKKSHFKGFDT
jgi:hypothetical protein